MVVTLLVVAWIIVPQVDRLVGALGGYDPQGYEPKDFARQHWLETKGRLLGLPGVPGEVVVNVFLFLLVAVAWLAIVPPGASRR